MRMLSPGDEPSGACRRERPGRPVVAIVGPTAVGKTALAVRLAEAVNGEIVSADSRQVYRSMDVGTAKATPAEQARVRHHLLDLLDPDSELTLAGFQELAFAALDEILGRGKIPLLVGGTGQYVMAVVEGWQVPRVPPDRGLRKDLVQEAEEKGAEAIHARLRALDPVAAERIDARNLRRVVRALEVCLITGQPFSQQQRKTPPPYDFLLVGLNLPRAQLYQRIDRRIELMMQHGLEDEVRRLVAAGYGFDRPAMSGVGYGQFAPYLAGEATLEDVVSEIKRASRRFVRHQTNWFRADDRRIQWFQAEPDPYSEVLSLMCQFLSVRSAGSRDPADEVASDSRPSAAREQVIR